MTSPRLVRGRHSQQHAVYSVTITTHQRRQLFIAPALAGLVRAHLSQSDHESSTRTHAWVLMPDHLHWLFVLQSGDLARAMRRFKSRSGRAVNEALGATGPVWQAGYYDHCVRDYEDLSAQAHYLIANPVRKGLVDNPHHYPHWGCRWIPNQYPISAP